MYQHAKPDSATIRPLTDFGRHSHPELVRMLFAGDPPGPEQGARIETEQVEQVRRVGDHWHNVFVGLHARADDIERELLGDFSRLWTGPGADEYKRMILDLLASIRGVGETAQICRDLDYRTSEALASAQAQMPPPVPVSSADPTVAALAAGTLPTPTAVALFEAAGPGRAALLEKIQNEQLRQSDANSAHDEAVRVMTELAGHYVAVEQAFPLAPTAASPPAPGAPPVAEAAPPPGTTAPLFGGVYRAGLAAASGLFAGGARQALDRLMGPEKDAKAALAPDAKSALATDAKSTLASDAKSVLAREAKVTSELGAGWSGSGGGGGGGMSGGPASVAVGSPELTGGGGGAGTTAAAGTDTAASSVTPAGAGASGVAAAAGRSGMPMGGMMGMAPMAAAGMGGMGGGGDMGGRVPQWLEQEDKEKLWGGDEWVAMSPSVVGEAPPPPPSSRRGTA